MSHHRLTGWFNRFCQIGYLCGLSIALLVIALAPLRQTSTVSVNLLKTYPDHQATFSIPAGAQLRVDQQVSMYRFNPSWTAPIGTATVTRIADGLATIRFDPQRFSWPVSVQGTVIGITKGILTINVGSSAGVKLGSIYQLFRGRQKLARARVLDSTQQTARLELLDQLAIDPVGLTASPFTIPTSVAFPNNRIPELVEWLALAVVGFILGLWILGFSRIFVFGRSMTRIRKGFRSRVVHIATHWIIGPIAIWILTQFTILTLAYLGFRINQWLPEGLTLVITDWTAPYRSMAPLVQPLALILYFRYLLTHNTSPLLALWNFFTYHPLEFTALRKLPKPLGTWHRRTWNWILHLAIAYAFATTLLQFLVNNFTVMASLGWRDQGLDFQHWGVGFSSFLKLVSTSAATRSPAETFGIARLWLFNITIFGCMLGYGHTVLSILWTKNIRNVDFTIAGWVVNGVCYGTLIAAVPWSMTTARFALEPGITEGPLFWFIAWGEFFLNLIYTLSIFNLGKYFGVMTDKGVRVSGFYAVVRHPSYTIESLMFVVIGLPAATTPSHYLGLFTFVILYWLRSEREDHFMSVSNPEYLNYQSRVPYKFIPGLY